MGTMSTTLSASDLVSTLDTLLDPCATLLERNDWMRNKVLSFFIMVCFLAPVTAMAGDITVVCVGDIYLGGWVTRYLERFGPAYPYRYTAGVLREADIAIANLESPITDSTDTSVEKEFLLRADPVAVKSLKDSIDIVTLANNHIMDYGEEGLRDTLSLLDSHGILHTGAGADLDQARRPAVVDVGGVKVAVLAFSNTLPKSFYAKKDSPGTFPGFVKYIRRDVRDARSHADIVIVSFHWGEEGLKHPKDYQVRLAHLAIDSGAHLVIGHHPHTIQSVEIYRNGLIFYSLGNFVFGSYSHKGVEGMMAMVVFSMLDDGGYAVKSARVVPLNVDNRFVHFRPVPLKGADAEAALKEIEERSVRFNTVLDMGRTPEIPAFGLIVTGSSPAAYPRSAEATR